MLIKRLGLQSFWSKKSLGSDLTNVVTRLVWIRISVVGVVLHHHSALTCDTSLVAEQPFVLAFRRHSRCTLALVGVFSQ